jgi:hypothetical protein
MSRIVPNAKALMDSFFHEQDQQLLQRLREKYKSESAKQALTSASGIRDEAVLGQLVSLEIGPDTLLALTLVPLVEVAWASGRVDAKEYAAILQAAEEMGVDKGSESHELLEEWLKTQPDAQLLEAWKSYVNALAKTMTSEESSRLQEALLGRARSVALASGGILSSGLGNKISAAEQAVLAQLEQAFAIGDA